MLRLKELRKQKKITQQTLSEVLGLARTSYTNIENGNRDPDTATLLKLADFFNVTTDYLLGRTENPAPTPQPTVSQQDLDKLEKMKSLPADRRKAIEILMNYEEQSATKSG